MPYYLYKINHDDGIELVKNLKLLGHFDNFKAAKTVAKQLRSETDNDEFIYKVMFADNPLHAEEQLQEKRGKPVLMEYER
jgi:hypothetical protein